jgi:putative transposase
MRNVSDRLPKEERDQAVKAMRAAYRLAEAEGIAKLRKLAEWLRNQDRTDAAASLL